MPARSHVVFLDLEVVMRECFIELPAIKAIKQADSTRSHDNRREHPEGGSKGAAYSSKRGQPDLRTSQCPLAVGASRSHSVDWHCWTAGCSSTTSSSQYCWTAGCSSTTSSSQWVCPSGEASGATDVLRGDAIGLELAREFVHSAAHMRVVFCRQASTRAGGQETSAQLSGGESSGEVEERA